jgi:hypothetical protein
LTYINVLKLLQIFVAEVAMVIAYNTDIEVDSMTLAVCKLTQLLEFPSMLTHMISMARTRNTRIGDRQSTLAKLLRTSRPIAVALHTT